MALRPENRNVSIPERAACTQKTTLTGAQQQLVTDHLAIVPAIAKQLVKRLSLPHWIDIDEMVSCGYVGLCNAALSFDPTRNIKFGTYAHFRIRGAVIDDFLRKQDVATDDLAAVQAETRQLDHLADPTPSMEDTMIDEQEQRRKCRHLAFAKLSMGEIEYRAVTKKHLQGQTLKEIGAAENRSATWAFYRVHCGERQLRQALTTCAD